MDEAVKYNNAGNSKYEADEYCEAITLYSKAIDIAPQNAEYYNNRGDAYYELKKYDLAIKDYTKAHNIDPCNETYLKNIQYALNCQKTQNTFKDTYSRYNQDKITSQNKNSSESLEEKSSYAEALHQILQKRNIKKLLHFTAICNLGSILNYGICDVITQENYNIKADKNDNYRYDGRPDCISLSIEHPNAKFFYKLNANRGNQYCVLVLDAEEILVKMPNKKYFYNTNASNGKYKNYKNANDRYLESIQAFEKMFDSNNSKYPADIQAEIMFQGVIPAEFIKEIHVKSRAPYNAVKYQINQHSYQNKIEVIENTKYFNYEHE